MIHKMPRKLGTALRREFEDHKVKLKEDYWESIKIIDVEFEEISTSLLSEAENRNIKKTIYGSKVFIQCETKYNK